jgi:hypothetical protein
MAVIDTAHEDLVIARAAADEAYGAVMEAKRVREAADTAYRLAFRRYSDLLRSQAAAGVMGR